MSSTLADKMVLEYVGRASVTPAEKKKAQQEVAKLVRKHYPSCKSVKNLGTQSLAGKITKISSTKKNKRVRKNNSSLENSVRKMF